jgi:hypothetical protein
VENVYQNIGIIEHHPLAQRIPIHSSRQSAIISFQSPFDFARYRFQLRLGISRTDDKEISKTRNSAQIEDNDALRFLIRRKLSTKPG